jgi:hypothetical protein
MQVNEAINMDDQSPLTMDFKIITTPSLPRLHNYERIGLMVGGHAKLIH